MLLVLQPRRLQLELFNVFSFILNTHLALTNHWIDNNCTEFFISVNCLRCLMNKILYLVEIARFLHVYSLLYDTHME